MEQSDIDLSCGSLTGREYADPAEGSTNGSPANSPNDQARETTPQAAKTLRALDVELSILQTLIDQFTAIGGTVRVIGRTENDRPILTLSIYGATQCPKCNFWTMLSQCPNKGCEK